MINEKEKNNNFFKKNFRLTGQERAFLDHSDQPDFM